MSSTIFYRGSSRDNTEAKKILKENKIEFVEVFSNDQNHAPVLFTDENNYSYKGLNEIIEYTSSLKSSNKGHP